MLSKQIRQSSQSFWVSLMWREIKYEDITTDERSWATIHLIDFIYVNGCGEYESVSAHAKSVPDAIEKILDNYSDIKHITGYKVSKIITM